MIALLGFGKTNQALLHYINAQGIACVIGDDSFKSEREDDFGNLFTPTPHRYPTTLQIPSPGIPPTHPMIQDSPSLLSEYDYILSHIQAPQIWISGTNGKTTTTEMLEWVLRDFGGACGGNIGIPLATLALQNPKIYILETSSFSLHYTQKVAPQCYILLPLSQDHILWHGSYEDYAIAKLSVLARMSSKSVAFIPHALRSHPLLEGFTGTLHLYQSSQDLASLLHLQPHDLAFKEPFLLDALLALCGAEVMCGEKRVRSIQDFKVGDHKIQELADAKGRIWVNDSKGTNADATIWALRNYKDKKLYLILGGDDKGADLSALFEEMRGYDIMIFAIGSNAHRLQDLCSLYHLPCKVCVFLDEAIKEIDLLHTPQSIALLSPAAASLDQFASYKHRGEEFVKAINSLN